MFEENGGTLGQSIYHVIQILDNNMSYGATVGASAANSNLIEFKK